MKSYSFSTIVSFILYKRDLTIKQQLEVDKTKEGNSFVLISDLHKQFLAQTDNLLILSRKFMEEKGREASLFELSEHLEDF